MTFRPLGARLVAYVAGVCLLAVYAVVAVALPPEIRAAFSALQRATLLLFLLVILAALWGIARCRVETDEDGIRLVNGYRRHRFGWGEVVDVSLRRGAPWGVLSTEDDRSYAMLGVQASDGRRASDAIWNIREQILEHRGRGPAGRA